MRKPFTKASELIYRGNIVFTKLNHGDNNPTADGYVDEIIDSHPHVYGFRVDAVWHRNHLLVRSVEQVAWGFGNLAPARGVE